MNETGNTSKNILLAVVGVIVLLVIILFLSGSGPKTGQKPNPYKQEPQKVTRQEVPKEQAPSGFPADIPIETGAKITQNFLAKVSDGRTQATRVFESKKTVKQNYDLYASFLTKNTWKTDGSSETPNLSSLLATKGGSQLTINIAKNTISGIVTVELNYISK